MMFCMEQPRRYGPFYKCAHVLMHVFVTSGMAALFVAYTKYATVMDEASKVLNCAALAELAESLSDELSPLTMSQHLSAPLEAAQRMAVQLKAVLDMTPLEHSDRQ